MEYKKELEDKYMRVLWTDGSAEPNPGPGGYAVIEEGKPIALGREDKATNIKMEGMAILAAMKEIDESGVSGLIVTDSEFWVNTLNNWILNWKRHDWTKKTGPIKNLELVKELFYLYYMPDDFIKYGVHDEDAEFTIWEKRPDISVCWVRGHAGTEYNELADEWANKAREGATL